MLGAEIVSPKLFAVLLLAAFQPGPAPEPAPAPVTIEAPDTVDAYQLAVVRVSTDAEQVRLRVSRWAGGADPTATFSVAVYETKSADAGVRQYVFAAAPGRWLVTADCVPAGGGIASAVAVVTIAGAPSPGPGPGPAPIDDAFARIAATEIAKLDQAAKSKAVAIADNYDAAAAAIAAGTGVDVETVLGSLRDKNRAATTVAERQSWLPFFEAWKSEADRRAAAGTLTNLDDYAAAFRTTAAAIRRAAK